MTDFDFEELDKAVNGALGTNFSSAPTPRTTPASSPTQETASNRDAESRSVSRPSLAPAARRSSGRFMDMVHPSSDMRTSQAPRAATPPSFDMQTPARRVSSNEEEVIDTPGKDEDIESTMAFEPTPVASEWSSPLESPFLPDTKVEKRPLGGDSSSYNQPPQEPEDELLLEAPDDPRLEATTIPDPIDFAAQNSLFEEKEETSEVFVQEVEPDTRPEPFISDSAPSSTPTPDPIPASKPLPIEDEHSGPTSITQQYSDKPSSQPESGAIYDTEAYHRPMTNVVKKRSSAWVILWIALLVLGGAAVGAGIYLFVLPML